MFSTDGLGMVRLPHDTCRCAGDGCGVKDECLRHVALIDMGPRTPVSSHVCRSIDERESFVLAAKDE